MRTIRTNISTDSIVTIDELKQKLKLTTAAFDDELTTILAAVEERLDGDHGVLNSSVRESTWVLHLDQFPKAGQLIVLPYPPITNLVGVEYDSDNGTTQPLTATLCYDGARGYVRATWPTNIATDPVTEPVRVTYDAGYTMVPTTIKVAALAMATSMFDNGELYSETVYKRNPQFMSMLREYRY